MWVLRAAHSGSGKEAAALTGQEVVPDVESEELRTMRTCMTYIQEKLYEVKPATGASFYPLVFILETDEKRSNECKHVLDKLGEVHFSRGGKLEVIPVPKEGERFERKSEQDNNPEDAWAWGTLMPLYFSTLADKEPQWMVPSFQMRWVGEFECEIGGLLTPKELKEQWGICNGKLFARHVGVVLVFPLSSERVYALTVFQHDKKPSKAVWNLPGGTVDRGVDKSWAGAAEREYREEVNPANLEEWSWKNACDGEVIDISIQNLMKPDNGQNMSRPCVNFLLARAKPQFVRSTFEKGEHPQGGRKISLPEDFVTHLPHIGTERQKKVLRYWRDKKLPFLEHDRLLWFPLDLKAGKPCAERLKVHNYLWIVARALQIPPVSQDKGVPRQDARVGPCIQKILEPGAMDEDLAEQLLEAHLQACNAAGPGQHGGKDGQDGMKGKGKGAGSQAYSYVGAGPGQHGGKDGQDGMKGKGKGAGSQAYSYVGAGPGQHGGKDGQDGKNGKGKGAGSQAYGYVGAGPWQHGGKDGQDGKNGKGKGAGSQAYSYVGAGPWQHGGKDGQDGKNGKGKGAGSQAYSYVGAGPWQHGGKDGQDGKNGKGKGAGSQAYSYVGAGPWQNGGKDGQDGKNGKGKGAGSQAYSYVGAGPWQHGGKDGQDGKNGKGKGAGSQAYSYVGAGPWQHGGKDGQDGKNGKGKGAGSQAYSYVGAGPWQHGGKDGQGGMNGKGKGAGSQAYSYVGAGPGQHGGKAKGKEQVQSPFPPVL